MAAGSCSSSVDASEVFRRLAPSIRKSCSAGEREDLIGMLKAVATAEVRSTSTCKTTSPTSASI